MYFFFVSLTYGMSLTLPDGQCTRSVSTQTGYQPSITLSNAMTLRRGTAFTAICTQLTEYIQLWEVSITLTDGRLKVGERGRRGSYG